VSATLRLYATSDPTTAGPGVYPTTGGWAETSVTWDTRPIASGPAVAQAGAMAANAWASLDVTPLVTGNGELNLLLKQSGTDGVIFYAREESGYEPQLVVTTIPPTAPPLRYMYDSGGAQSTVAADGWDLLDVNTKAEADALPAGARALMWVGDYDNSKCAWEMSDSALSSLVSSTVGDAKVAGYFISDEPDPYACPNAPAEHKSRTQLIHSIDPNMFTLIVLDSNSGQQSLNQVPLWAGTADYIGLDPYPCYQGKPCDFSWIDQMIQAADQAGLTYWGVVQAFQDSTWRWPTADEEQHMLAQWAASNMKGYATFAWTWAGNTLASQPGLLSVLDGFNATATTGTTTTRA
jgi:hypothetical protein